MISISIPSKPITDKFAATVSTMNQEDVLGLRRSVESILLGKAPKTGEIPIRALNLGGDKRLFCELSLRTGTSGGVETLLGLLSQESLLSLDATLASRLTKAKEEDSASSIAFEIPSTGVQKAVQRESEDLGPEEIQTARMDLIQAAVKPDKNAVNLVSLRGIQCVVAVVVSGSTAEAQLVARTTNGRLSPLRKALFGMLPPRSLKALDEVYSRLVFAGLDKPQEPAEKMVEKTPTAKVPCSAASK